MIKSIIIPIHSFVDLITNSSSESYISSSESTIKAVKELVNNILELAGSTQKFDDLFTIDIVFDYFGKVKDMEGFSHYFTEAELRKLEEDGRIDEGETDSTIEPSDETFRNSLRVLPKIDNELTQKISHRLSNITSMFNIEAGYNG